LYIWYPCYTDKTAVKIFPLPLGAQAPLAMPMNGCIIVMLSSQPLQHYARYEDAVVSFSVYGYWIGLFDYNV